MKIVFAYDISSDKRRNKIYKVLKNFGSWMQYSVFECELEEKEYLKLKDRLSELIKEEDKIITYFLCSSCERRTEKIGDYKVIEEDGVIL